MKTAKKISLWIATGLFLLFIMYLVWANTGIGSKAPQKFQLDITETYGDSASAANVVGVQAFMEPIDYASEENFSKKIGFYLAEAKKRSWLIPNKTIVVFPEYIGTWLVTLNEKESIYHTPKIEEGLQIMVMRNIGKFFKTYINSPDSVKDKVKYSVFAMKASAIAKTYQQVFATLAKEYQVTIVGGSILLPEPSVENGVLKTGNGLLYNTSVVFEPDGAVNPHLIRKAFPTADELGFICPVKPDEIPVFQTSIGRMGVLICADAWFSDAYKSLKNKGVDFVITPSYSNGLGNWEKAWSGYSGAETPKEAKPDIGKISLGSAWVKYAMGTRARTEAGVKKGMNVFLQGNLWDLGTDGSTIVLSDSAHTTPYIGKPALINLWL